MKFKVTKKVLGWLGKKFFQDIYRFYNPDKIPLLRFKVSPRDNLENDICHFINKHEKNVEVVIYEIQS